MELTAGTTTDTVVNFPFESLTAMVADPGASPVIAKLEPVRAALTTVGLLLLTVYRGAAAKGVPPKTVV